MELQFFSFVSCTKFLGYYLLSADQLILFSRFVFVVSFFNKAINNSREKPTEITPVFLKLYSVSCAIKKIKNEES